ncbi:Na+/H+ antiporter NhaA [Agrococcus carbonis]|uniref:Na(+)/H(+) antiporter NhaA n=1 Tax=Agrococcus carbonis TaxID=684552 RepID=A0A1H1KZA8_9MICO|nr:Na+/H+ antiporter NhaA [Agrococcus carbonis]SDR67370.1 sodium/proton antiporter, NhaA family [Agrococcus carbonis]
MNLSWIRNPQVSAMLLLGAAILGLVLANTALGPALDAAKHAHLPFTILGLDLSAAHWVTDGLLVVFFFVVAVELRYEFTQGDLNSIAKAAVPTIAALGGVALPAIIYFTVAGEDGAQGWPIPTATDIAFALGVLALFGRRLPTAVRALLLALAVIDDLIGILFIAVFFTEQVEVPYLALAAVGVVAFWALGRVYRGRRGSWPLRIALVLVAVITWWLVAMSGIHATIAGVLLGLVLAPAPAESARLKLEPFSNGVVLPLFAFTSASVAIPQVPITELSGVFWAIVIALPVGKLFGVTIAGLVGQAALRVPKADRLRLRELIGIGLLAGIGFTVSLLMNELAHRSAEELIVEGTLGVLTGSLISAVLGGAYVALLSRRYPPVDAAERSSSDAQEQLRRTDAEG